MTKEIISTDKAPPAIGPYSQGIKVGNLIYTSGQLPIDMKSGQLVTNDIKKATKASLDNVQAILEEVGSSMEKVIKTVVFIKDLEDFVAMNEVYESYFSKKAPARSCVQVAKLPKDAIVEIEVIAQA
ncbi:RidA family protein [Schnuerera sp. xch1]|uniref:RidA family protein n=1 Tax=Schnuerera sp. xch1 TaxID=2874283 RepID=UPI001CBC667F|nr:RidA family protein [Schnuerera sp. xch1]MBZ2174972.1 RidA family protein [Schnuerera sp. xch1]